MMFTIILYRVRDKFSFVAIVWHEVVKHYNVGFIVQLSYLHVGMQGNKV